MAKTKTKRCVVCGGNGKCPSCGGHHNRACACWPRGRCMRCKGSGRER